MSEHFDVVVLGAGPGGYVAAIRASQLGLSTAVVESKYWGGVCLNVGCIPSKALLRNAELAHLVMHEAATFGISFDGEAKVDYGVAFKRSRVVADGRVKGVHYLMKKNKITEFTGRGSFTDANTLEVAQKDGSSQTITFDNCIIAAGATTRLLPGTSLSERVVTYEEQIMSDSLPASIIIAGAGAIGVEFAYILSNYGVDVTVVEFLDRVVPLEDEEVSKELSRRFKKAGIRLLTGTRVDAIDDSGDTVKVTVTKGESQEVLEAEKVMQAIGFAPRVEGYGLEKTGVAVEDVDVYVPHQANVRIIDHAVARLGIPEERVVMNVDRYGNTSSASIPLALADAVDDGRVKQGSMVLMTGMGAGLTWGSALMRWTEA